MYRYCQSNCPFLSPLVSRLDVWPQAQPHSCPMFRPIARFCQCSNVVPMFQKMFRTIAQFCADNSGDSRNITFAKDNRSYQQSTYISRNLPVLLRMLQQNQRIRTPKEQESVAASTTLIFFPRLTIRLRFFLSQFLWFAPIILLWIVRYLHSTTDSNSNSITNIAIVLPIVTPIV